ncbi:MAG: acylphosphatase [Minisyncoccia bacterium]
MEEFHAIVSGRVQMVTYRAFVEKHARQLALTGFVRNLENGNVEVVAQGEKEKLEELLMHLRKGSLFAHVEDVQVDWREPAGQCDGFEIIY